MRARLRLRRLWWRYRRPARHAAANAGGYFWLPCPLCGEPFAGTEAATTLAVPTGDHMSQMACRLCEDEWTANTAGLCADVGHDPVIRWHGQPGEPTRDGATTRTVFTFSEQSYEIRCSRCHTLMKRSPS